MGFKRLVFRQEPDAVGVGSIALDRGLVAEQRDYDIAALSAVLLAGDDNVAVENPGVAHALAVDAQREDIARSGNER